MSGSNVGRETESRDLAHPRVRLDRGAGSRLAPRPQGSTKRALPGLGSEVVGWRANRGYRTGAHRVGGPWRARLARSDRVAGLETATTRARACNVPRPRLPSGPYPCASP